VRPVAALVSVTVVDMPSDVALQASLTAARSLDVADKRQRVRHGDAGGSNPGAMPGTGVVDRCCSLVVKLVGAGG
ncbi:MAG: hypothetical protein AAF235_06190, partial [Planctomycetota bacterium]